MSPMTLTVLATLLNLHGPQATLRSDNAGIESVLQGVQSQAKQAEAEQPTVVPAFYSRFYHKLFYVKQYVKFIR
jgi:hypothetical protein